MSGPFTVLKYITLISSQWKERGRNLCSSKDQHSRCDWVPNLTCQQTDLETSSQTNSSFLIYWCVMNSYWSHHQNNTWFTFCCFWGTQLFFSLGFWIPFSFQNMARISSYIQKVLTKASLYLTRNSNMGTPEPHLLCHCSCNKINELTYLTRESKQTFPAQ